VKRFLQTAQMLLRRWPLALEAAVFLTAGSVAKGVLPGERIARLLGKAAPPEPCEAGPPGAEAALVGYAVSRVARLLPWHPTCLPQALAARMMLRRRGVACVSHLGVFQTQPVKAHAWVTVNGRVVQGGPVRHIAEVARFR
jgi:hypothetical protein